MKGDGPTVGRGALGAPRTTAPHVRRELVAGAALAAAALVVVLLPLRKPVSPLEPSSRAAARTAVPSLPSRVSPPRVTPPCAVDLSDLPPPPTSTDEIVWGGPGMPVVRAELGGCAFAALVDTGVTQEHMLSGWFARRLGLRMRKGARSGLDSAGRRMTVAEIDPVALTVPTLHGNVPILAVEPSADNLREFGIAVVLAPRALAGHDRVLALELGPRSRMRFVSTAEAGALHPGPLAFDVPDCDGSTIVTVTLEGRPARLQIDTGSMTSLVYAPSDAGRNLATRVTAWDAQPSYGVGGPMARAKMPGLDMVLASRHVSVNIQLVNAPGRVNAPACGIDGVIGVDFLVVHRCTLLVEPERMRGYCEHW